MRNCRETIFPFRALETLVYTDRQAKEIMRCSIMLFEHSVSILHAFNFSLFLDYYLYVMSWLSEEVWLPPGIRWEELEGEEFAQFHHLLFPFIFSILFIG